MRGMQGVTNCYTSGLNWGNDLKDDSQVIEEGCFS
eukprot:COSAG01_NODE_62371_length_285_cov_0.494624_1_plen_34_part_10